MDASRGFPCCSSEREPGVLGYRLCRSRHTTNPSPRLSWPCRCRLLVPFLLVLGLMATPVSSKSRQEILRSLLTNHTGTAYDYAVPPNYEEDVPTDVSVQIFVISFDSVREVSMEFSVSVFLRQNWTDPRLQWDDPEVRDRLEVDPKMMQQVWVPDLYFLNEKEAVMHEVTVSNKLLHIHKDGTVLHSMRLSMTLSCDLYLERYPHDDQTCSLLLGSYSFSENNVIFRWVETPIIMRPEMTLPRFQVKFDKVKDCVFKSTTSSSSMVDGNYSCIQADFHLSREFGYYIAQVYVPSILIVMLSWVSFWIDIDATPARVSLGLLTVLTLTTQSTGEKAALPRVSYIKAIDVWMSTCLFFVFAALLEFAYVNVQSRVEKRRRGREAMTSSTVNATTLSSIPVTEPVGPLALDKDAVKAPTAVVRGSLFVRDPAKLQRARATDKMSRAVFPAVFGLFNMVYWVYYSRG